MAKVQLPCVAFFKTRISWCVHAKCFNFDGFPYSNDSLRDTKHVFQANSVKVQESR